jgi:hypothetical protein
MAVNIDTVYQRVLGILNKEQRGYLTPQEFNLFANQVQLDIFEQYFYDINQFGRIEGNSTEYSDMLSILNEKIDAFSTSGALTYSSNTFALPSNLYRLGTVIYTNAGEEIEAERILKNEFLYIKSSPIAKPRNDRPIYIADSVGIKVYGNAELTSGVKCNYIRKPAKAIWAYQTVFGSALYDATNSVDFELHPSDETELVIKILGLAGLLLKEADIYQAAGLEETKSTQQEKA